MIFTPRQYQLEGKKFLRSRRFAMLGDAPGVGKTGQAIIAANPNWRILVVCPASVKSQWQKVWTDWSPAAIQPHILGNKTNCVIPNVFITNYDRIFRSSQLPFLISKMWDLIIFDEAHKLKSMSSKRTKIALGQKYLRPRAKRMWFLTGTPVKNRTVDLYPILKSCAPEVLGKYDSYLKFVYRYCGAYKGRFGLDVMGASHTEELAERMKTFMLRREKRDVLTELPPRVLSKIDLPCTPQARNIIAEEEQITMDISGEEDPTKFKLGEQARIRQALAKYKVPVSIDYIKDLLYEEEKVVIFYHHKGVLNELQKYFHNVPSVYVDGSVRPDKRSGIVEVFRSEKKVRLFFGQMQACGEGIDGLQDACCTCVFVEPSWSHTDMEQCIGRLERSGQRSDVNVHILVIKDTLESRMMDVVAEKLKVDKKLYNIKENKMAKKKLDPMERLAAALESIAESLVKLVNQEPETDAAPAVVASDPAEVEAPVEVEKEEDVTIEALKARAADVCSLAPDGSAKTKVVEVIKKIGGGKMADLKTPKQRVEALAAFDKLYNDFDV